MLESEWRPFDRFAWSLLGSTLVSSMLAAKVLRPCPACNPERRAPWAREFQEQQAPAAQNGGGDVPF